VGLDLIIDVNGYFDTGAAGPTGPQGPAGVDGAQGPQGPPGNIVLANQMCPGFQVVKGFDPNGSIICGPLNAANFFGVQVNTPISALVGWTQCYIDTYDNGSTSVASILAACNGNNLLLACRVAGSPTLTTFAHAPRENVLFDVGSQQNSSKSANGAAWYFSDSFSWGYAPAGQGVDRQNCDIASQGNGDRLCWHTSLGNINPGFRCGSNTFLTDATYERIIYQAN
jgi:hypothetical protein